MAEAAALNIDVQPITLPRTAQVFDPAALAELLGPLALDGMIHAAAVLNPRNDHDDRVNAEVPCLLRDAAASLWPSARFMHISTLNVIDPARTDRYSRTKKEAERLLTTSASAAMPLLIVRPGLLWSWTDDAGGDAARLRRYLRRPLPVHPVPRPGQIFYPVPVRAFARKLLSVLTQGEEVAVANAFGDTAVSLFDLAAGLARREGRAVMPVPVSWLAPIFPKKSLPGLAMNLGLVASKLPIDDPEHGADVWRFAWREADEN